MPGDTESVCLETRRHGIVLLWPLGRAITVALGGSLLVAAGWPATILGTPVMVLAAALGLVAVWQGERPRLVVTTDKVFVVRGTVRRRASAVRLGSIRELELEEPLL